MHIGYSQWVIRGPHTQATSSESNKVTQSQPTTQGQSLEAKLASLEVMVKQVLNSDQAMGS
jgi:hypothetical protein